MNTKIISTEYDYIAPKTLEEALKILNEKDNVRILAGGTDLIVKLKTDAIKNLDYMLDIKRIPNLDYIRLDEAGNSVHIGALAKMSHIEKNPIIVEKYSAISSSLKLIASISVRNLATMAGNICNSSPVADSVIPAITYGAKVKLVSLKGAREVELKDFFLAPGVNVMDKGEILEEIIIPCPKANTGGYFIKKSRIRSDITKISIAAVIEREGNRVKDCKLAMAAIAATPLYLKDVGDSMIGKEMNEKLLKNTAEMASKSIKPIDDNRTTAEYRTAISEVATYDVLKEAWLNAGGEL